MWGASNLVHSFVWTSERRKEWNHAACGRQGCWASAEQNLPLLQTATLFSVLRGPCDGGVASSLALTSIPSSFSIPLCYSRVFRRQHHPAPSNKNLLCLKLSGSSCCCFVLERNCTPDAHSFSPVQAFLWREAVLLHQLLDVTDKVQDSYKAGTQCSLTKPSHFETSALAKEKTQNIPVALCKF